MINRIFVLLIVLSLIITTNLPFYSQDTQSNTDVAAPTPVQAQESATIKIKRTLPAGARVYVRLLEEVSGKRGDAQPGQKVRCEVWRDVVFDGDILIKAGTHVLVKVDEVKHAKIAGVKGKVSLAAFETTTVDGQPVLLDGGYMKAGKSRIGLSVTLGAVLFIPLIFIMGKAAILPVGMVFDTFTASQQTVVIEKERTEAAAPVFNLSKALAKMTAEVLMDNLQNEKDPEYFIIRVETPNSVPTKLFIDSMNGRPIEKPIELEITETVPHDNGATILTKVKIKKLAELFQKGINRFDVSCQENGAKIATEVILNAQI